LAAQLECFTLCGYFQFVIVPFTVYGIVTHPLEEVCVFVCQCVQPVRGTATAHCYTEFTVVPLGVPRFQEIALAPFTIGIYFVAAGQGKPYITFFALGSDGSEKVLNSGILQVSHWYSSG
jgi:hypothetical protein